MDKKKTRYFFIAYTVNNLSGGYGYGNLYFPYDGMPSHSWIKQKIKHYKDSVDIDSIVISNIQEFKSRSDFDSFRKEDE